MNRQLELFQTIHESQKPDCFLGAVSGSEFMSIVEVALRLAFEAGKWEGQVELEEHYDREQYSSSVAEVFHSHKNAMPLKDASNGRTVTINLRSDEWRNGVRKSAKEYVDKAKLLVFSHYRKK
jgi:hypothetical protein